MKSIIKENKSVIPACDVPLELYEKIVKETADVKGIGAYKIGFFLGLRYGLPEIVKITREYTDKPIIYDHQKAGTDIPDLGRKFIDVCKNAGIDAVILFPQSGPKTEEEWIKAAKEEGLGVIVGGLMTHAGYTDEEGGWIRNDRILDIYSLAANLGVTDFVVPGNKPEYIKKIREFLEEKGVSPTFYAPGFVTQGGEITEAAKVAGEQWHAIVGRGIYKAQDIKKAALELTSKLG